VWMSIALNLQYEAHHREDPWRYWICVSLKIVKIQKLSYPLTDRALNLPSVLWCFWVQGLKNSTVPPCFLFPMHNRDES
jgi:hypothetical protein